MTVAYPIAHAWLSTGGTGAQNYDEFADDAEITAIIAANPASALAIEMPHRAPDNLGRASATPARRRGAPAAGQGRRRTTPPPTTWSCSTGSPRPTADTRRTGCGAWSTPTRSPPAPTSRAWSSATRTSSSRRSASASPSPRPLSTCCRRCCCCRPAHGDAAARRRSPPAADAPARPAVTDIDPAGRTPRDLARRRRPARDELRGPGRRRRAGRRRRQPPQPRRADRRLPAVPRRGHHARVGGDPAVQPAGHRAAGRRRRAVERLARPARTVDRGPPAVPATGGTIHLYARGGACAVELPRGGRRAVVDNLDHALVERVLFGETLGLDPGDKRITYVGGDYPA